MGINFFRFLDFFLNCEIKKNLRSFSGFMLVAFILIYLTIFFFHARFNIFLLFAGIYANQLPLIYSLKTWFYVSWLSPLAFF